MKKSDVRKAYLEYSKNVPSRKYLCNFFKQYDHKLSMKWNCIWYSQNEGSINQFFNEEEYTDCEVLTYLTRCLSLNMFIEDNDL